MAYRGFGDEYPDEPETDRQARQKALSNELGLENVTAQDRETIALDALDGRFDSQWGCDPIATITFEYQVEQALPPGSVQVAAPPSEEDLESDPVFSAIIDRWSDCMREEGFENVRNDEDVERLESQYYAEHPSAGSSESVTTDPPVDLGEGFETPPNAPDYVVDLWTAYDKCGTLIEADALERFQEMSDEQ